MPYTCQLSLFSLAATVNYIFAIIYVLLTLLLLYGVGPRVFFSSSRRILTFTVRYLSVDITGTYFRYNNQLIYYQILFQEVNLSLCSHPGCLGIGVATLFFSLGTKWDASYIDIYVSELNWHFVFCHTGFPLLTALICWTLVTVYSQNDHKNDFCASNIF